MLQKDKTLTFNFFFLSLSCGISANNRGDRANLPGVDAVCDDSSTRLSVPAIRHFNAGVPANVPPEPSLVDMVQGIHPGFLTRHSQDRDLCEIPQANVESHNSLLPEAGPYMARIIIFVRPSRATLYAFDCQQY